MYNTAVTTTPARTTQANPIPTTCGSYPHGANCSSRAQDDATSTSTGTTGESRVLLLICLRSIAAFVWAASRNTLQRMLLAYLQSALISPTWRSILAAIPRRLLIVSRGGVQVQALAVQDEDEDGDGVALRARDAVTVAHRATSPNGKKVSWSYLRGVSLALSELCQDGRFGGGRIPLSAILDLMRQHQSAFVPLGPHVEKDVPKRLVQLANENVVFFDPFDGYVIVPEATRQKYESRRRALLVDGVDPADLSVFGVALTRGLSPSKRVAKAAVASYQAQFLLAQQQRHQEPQAHPQQKEKTNKTQGRALTREESLLSIADAIRPPGLRLETDMADMNPTVTRRGHSIVIEMAKIIGWKLEGCERIASHGECGNQLRRERGRAVLPEISAIIHERDALEVENGRLRSILRSCQ